MKKLVYLFILVFSVCLISSCNQVDIKLVNENIELAVGETVDVNDLVDGTYTDIVFVSSDKYVAKIENNIVTGLATGNCQINVYCGKSNKSINVKVQYDESCVPFVKFDVDEMNVELYDRVKLDPIVNNLNKEEVNYSSSDETVITVENGIVIPHKAGSSIITASVDTYSTSVVVIVEANSSVPSLVIEQDEITLLNNQVFELNPYVLYKDEIKEGNYNFTISSGNHITLSENGVLTACSLGEQTVTITGSYNGYVFEDINIKVTVIEDVALITNVTNVNIYASNPNGNFVTTQPFNVEVLVDKTLVNNPSIIYEVENSEICQIQNNVIKGLSAGETKVNIKYSYNTVTYTAVINVNVLMPEISLDQKKIVFAEYNNNVLFPLTGDYDSSKFNRILIDDVEYTATASASGINVNKDLIGFLKQVHNVRIECSNAQFTFEANFITREIKTLNDLLAMYTSTDTLDGYYLVTTDIDCTGSNNVKLINGWSNVSNKGFIGIFDGQGHILKNLNISSSGIFYCVGQNGVIKNLGLVDCTGTGCVIASEFRGLVSNVFVTSSTKDYMSHMSNQATIENAIINFEKEDAKVVNTVFDSTVELKNVYAKASKWAHYDGFGISPAGELVSNLSELTEVVGTKTINQLGFDSTYWAIVNNNLMFKSYQTIVDSMQVINASLTFKSYNTDSPYKVECSDKLVTYSLKRVINGISITSDGYLTSQRATEIVVVITSIYGNQIEVTITCTN